MAIESCHCFSFIWIDLTVRRWLNINGCLFHLIIAQLLLQTLLVLAVNNFTRVTLATGNSQFPTNIF